LSAPAEKTGNEVSGFVNWVPRIRMIYLGWKAAVTDAALEWPLLGVAPIMDLQRRIAGKCLETDVASCVARAYCNDTTSETYTSQYYVIW